MLAEVIPEIELVLGKQGVPPALDSAEAQNRFRYVFQSFVAALAHKEHPLVVFLDDLQWVDAATLDLLHALLTGPGLNHVLFIGAYRDNEVDANHLLTWAIDRLQTAGALVPRVSLGPLSRPDVVLFLCETLHCQPGEVEGLAALILEKTDGNPFFVIQFLQDARSRKGLFTFDAARGVWSFRMDSIAAAGMTDNVIDLMTRKIRRLTSGAQRVLTLAACIGSPFEWRTLLTVSGQDGDAASAGLAEALDAGLLQPAVGRGDAVNFSTTGCSRPPMPSSRTKTSNAATLASADCCSPSADQRFPTIVCSRWSAISTSDGRCSRTTSSVSRRRSRTWPPAAKPRCLPRTAPLRATSKKASHSFPTTRRRGGRPNTS